MFVETPACGSHSEEDRAADVEELEFEISEKGKRVQWVHS